MHYMVQHPTNTAIYLPNGLLLICLLDREAYALIAVATAMCTLWQLKSSITLTVRKRQPQARPLRKQSTGHTRLGRLGTAKTMRSRLAAQLRCSGIALSARSVRLKFQCGWCLHSQVQPPARMGINTGWRKAASNAASRTVHSGGVVSYAARGSPTQRQDRRSGRPCAWGNPCPTSRV